MGGAESSSGLPRAPSVPVVGSLPHLIFEQLEFLEQAQRSCGSLFEVDVGVARFIMTGDPEVVEDIFVKRVKHWSKGGDFWDGAREMFGNGLPIAEGEHWRRNRRLMNPQFRRERIETLRGIIVTTIDELLDELDREVARATKGVVDISAWTARLLSTLTIRMLFGTELDSARAEEIREALSVMLDQLLSGMVTRKLPHWLPRPGARRFAEARELFDGTVLELIDRRRRRQEPGDDLLGLLIAATDEQGALSDQELRDEVMTTYIAGYETTAWALAWTLWQLGKRPAITRAIQAELEHEDDPLKAPLVDATFREGLRLFPSAPILPRRALNDEELRGHPIPEGTIVVVSPWLVHRNPEIWPDPGRFDPQRFLDEEQVAARHRQAWMPFGAGQRTCIGKGLALMEGRIALGELLRRFTPSPAPGPEPQIRLSTTLRARDGIPIVLEPR